MICSKKPDSIGTAAVVNLTLSLEMARKRNMLKNNIYQNGTINNHPVTKSTQLTEDKARANQVIVPDAEELASVDCQFNPHSPFSDQIDNSVTTGVDKSNQTKFNKKDHKQTAKTGKTSSSAPSPYTVKDATKSAACSTESREAKNVNGVPISSYEKSEGDSTIKSHCSAFKNFMGTLGLSRAINGICFRTSSAVILDEASRWLSAGTIIYNHGSRWLQRQKPWVSVLLAYYMKAHYCVIEKARYAWPILLRWLLHVGKLVILVSLVWLDCTLRGIDSLCRLGTTSFFTILWCSILAFSSMIGIFNLLMVLAIFGLTAYLLSLALGIVVLAFAGSVYLWFYGSFWVTGLFIVFGGVTFSLKLERLALLVTAMYAGYSAKLYVGWFGLLFGINLACISSDILIYFIKKTVKENKEKSESDDFGRTQEHGNFFSGQPSHAAFSDESFRSAFGVSSDRSQEVASTSGVTEIELTSEAEIERLLNCVDHYSVLGLHRYQSIDISSLKREYKKKAMLVHPDKNIGNENAVEAFKKLQNAYEVLLDSIKRKAYDDKLRREELFNCFRRFQSIYQKRGRQGKCFFPSGFYHNEAKEDDSYEEVRRIECKRCRKFHIWAQTNRSKAQARWCQDCKEFHSVKDGDGWVEQSSNPFLFRILQKVDQPHAYVCAESKIYDATAWFLCQGMRCSINTHKPTFHVNTSVVCKHNMMKGGGAAHGAGVPDMDEAMTEEAFFQWLQDAMQSGMCESNTTSENPASKGSSVSKGGGSKKKRRGKNQW